MHVGHGRTYTVPDIVARFWRMRGRQVLFPMGFHVTGTPVIGISKRIARKDEKPSGSTATSTGSPRRSSIPSPTPWSSSATLQASTSDHAEPGPLHRLAQEVHHR